MYICGNCGEPFYWPDEFEIRTDYGNLKIIDICPFCKSDDIEEVDDNWDPEVS